MNELVAAVKAHALEHYYDGGWDVVVECWEDEEISKALSDFQATTVAEALDAFAGLASVWREREAAARMEEGG